MVETGRFNASRPNYSSPIQVGDGENNMLGKDTIDFFYSNYIENWDTLTNNEKNKISEVIEILVRTETLKETFKFLNKFNSGRVTLLGKAPENYKVDMTEAVKKANQEIRGALAEMQERDKKVSMYRTGIQLMGLPYMEI